MYSAYGWARGVSEILSDIMSRKILHLEIVLVLMVVLYFVVCWKFIHRQDQKRLTGFKSMRSDTLGTCMNG